MFISLGAINIFQCKSAKIQQFPMEKQIFSFFMIKIDLIDRFGIFYVLKKLHELPSKLEKAGMFYHHYLRKYDFLKVYRSFWDTRYYITQGLRLS